LFVTVENDELASIEKVLLHLQERPEAKLSDAFVEDIYTCTRFARNQCKLNSRVWAVLIKN